MDSTLENDLERVVNILVLPMHFIPDVVFLGPFTVHRAEIETLHKEVQYCIWSIDVTVSVYMKLLNLVDIKIRNEISDNVSHFLAEWKGGKGQALYDALDSVVIAQFCKHSVTKLPDMKRLQCGSGNQHVFNSTVANYIRDIALRMHSMRQMDIDATIDNVFPLTKSFVGRRFFPRLAAVAFRLLELVRQTPPPV